MACTAEYYWGWNTRPKATPLYDPVIPEKLARAKKGLEKKVENEKKNNILTFVGLDHGPAGDRVLVLSLREFLHDDVHHLGVLVHHTFQSGSGTEAQGHVFHVSELNWRRFSELVGFRA